LLTDHVPDPVTGKAKIAFPNIPMPEGEDQPIISEDFLYQVAELEELQPPSAAERYDYIDFAAMSVGLDENVWESIKAFAKEVVNPPKKQATLGPTGMSSGSEPASDIPSSIQE
jgi:hypothetical protein